MYRDTGDTEAPPTVGSSRLEAGQSDSVDEHVPLLLSRVHKQRGVALSDHLKALAAEEAVLHSAVRLAEGGPCHHHRTRHSCEADNSPSRYVSGLDKKKRA